MRGSIPFTLAILATLLSVTSRARAFERQWHLGGGLGVAGVPGSDYHVGPLVNAHLAYGLTDMFDVRLELGLSQHVLGGSPEQTQRLYGSDVAFVYKIDVIEWVPYIGLLAGYHGATQPPRAAAAGAPAPFHQREGDVGLMLGVDYALTRSFALGAQLRYHSFLSEPTKTGYTAALFHAEYRWGW